MEVFEAELPTLLKSGRGKYVVIGGYPATVHGVFVTVDEAIAAGCEAFGPIAVFLVREITEPTAPKYFSRKVRPRLKLAFAARLATDRSINLS